MMKQEHADLINELQDEIHLSFDDAVHDVVEALLEREGLDADENEVEYLNRLDDANIHYSKPLAIQLIKQLADLYELKVTVSR